MIGTSPAVDEWVCVKRLAEKIEASLLITAGLTVSQCPL